MGHVRGAHIRHHKRLGGHSISGTRAAALSIDALGRLLPVVPRLQNITYAWADLRRKRSNAHAKLAPSEVDDRFLFSHRLSHVRLGDGLVQALIQAARGHRGLRYLM